MSQSACLPPSSSERVGNYTRAIGIPYFLPWCVIYYREQQSRFRLLSQHCLFYHLNVQLAEMPLFKVRTYNHPKKVCIEAESIAGLISKAIVKLKITTNEEFQIYLEDGTEVDEDDILIQLATNPNLINTLVILPVGLEWNDSFSNPLANSSATSSNSSSSSRSNVNEAERDNTGINVNINRNKLELEFHSTLLPKFPTRLLDACKKGKVPLTKDRKDMVAIIATYMLQDLKDSSRGTASTISRKLVKLYPDSFEDKINGKRLGSGEGSLSKQIYQAVNTRKSVKKRIINELETEGENLPAPHRDIGFYGCVDSLPTLPASDSVDVQEEKRIKLVDAFKNLSTESFDIVKLMDETYSLLRSHINNNTGSINPELFDNWPYLKSREVLLSHASRLLGIQVRETWDTQLNAKYTSILDFVQSWDTARNFKLRKTKMKNTESGSSKSFCGLLKNAREIAATQNNDAPLINIVFPIIAKWFKEDIDLLFLVTDQDDNDLALCAKAKSLCPTLLMKGTSIHDINLTMFVILEKKIIVPVAGKLSDGILTVMLFYFILGYSYPEKIANTLETIQRFFMNVNPPTGSKSQRTHDGKKKRITPYSPKVLSLAKEIENIAPEATSTEEE